MGQYQGLTVPELKKLLKDRKLLLSGRKADLVTRLEEYDASHAINDDAKDASPTEKQCADVPAGAGWSHGSAG
jgi:hypothetical protein